MTGHPADRLALTAREVVRRCDEPAPNRPLEQQTAILVLTTTARLYAPAAVGASHTRPHPTLLLRPLS